MDTKKLRQKILDLAIRGKLVPQDPNDEPASVLLERIKAEKEQLIKDGKIKRSKKSASSDTSPYENVPFEIPESWVWTTIGDIFIHNTGKALNAANNDGVLMDYITTSNLYWDKFDLTVVKQMLFTDTEIEKCTVKYGDLLVCEGGDIGRAAIWTYDYDVRIQNHIHRLRGFCNISHRFYYYIFLLYKMLNLIGGKGVAIQGLSSNDLHKLVIPLPPIKEQCRIVSIIESWFSVIDRVEQEKKDLCNAIKQIKSKILDLAIHGKLVSQDPNDEPAIELLRRINPSFKSCDNAHYKNLPFEIPESWVWVKHNDILEISGGAQPAKSYFSSVQLPNYIRLYQIRDYGDTPIPVYIPIELASKQTRKGDILLARYGGSLGKVFIAEDGAYNVAMAKIIFRYEQPINKDYVYYYYLSDIYQNKLKEISRTAQAGFNSNDFNEMFFPLPPINEQKRVVLEIKKYSELLDNIIAEL
ncbi:restriction endonuclease subunit S [Alistipes putredinis]|jgi:type I restriction modification DNA specificity domain protein|uniref:restriction endonuclease subunit S n=2 Tax=Alistipes putredinis TaxID=28117 RepID=UPI003AF1C019